MMTMLLLCAVLGLLISLYSFYIDKNVRSNPAYKPVCDISDRISCTRPILSEYSRLFFVSNSFMGIIFYGVMILCALFNLIYIAFYLSVVACLLSLYLAYLLYFKIKSLCIVCHALYIINIGLLIISYQSLL